jgi:hypothetical protein
VCVGYVVSPTWYWAVNRLAPIGARAYLRHIRGPLIGAAVLGGVLFGLRRLLGDLNPALALVLASGVGAVVYFATIRVVAAPLAAEGRELLRRALPGRSRREPPVFPAQVTEG